MKVTLVNAHWSNRGDESALRPIINILRKFDKVDEVNLLIKDRKEIQTFPYPDVKYYSLQFLPDNIEQINQYIMNDTNSEDKALRTTIDIIKASDLIIYSPGGGVISSRFWWRKQLEYLTPFMCAKQFSIPITVAAPSFGPFEQEEEKNDIIRKYLSISENIIVREPISKVYLNNIGLKDVDCTVDTAFYDTPGIKLCTQLVDSDKKLVEFLSQFGNGNRVVAVTMTDLSWNVGYLDKKDQTNQAERNLVTFFNKLASEGYGILLIPELFGNQNDYDKLTQFSNDKVFILSDTYDCYFQQYIISKCYALIGMRYHSNIFAAKMGTPFIAIGYEEKMYGFMERWDLADYLVNINDVNKGLLENKWIDLVDNYVAYKQILKANRDIWYHEASETIDSILRCL